MLESLHCQKRAKNYMILLTSVQVRETTKFRDFYDADILIFCSVNRYLW
jgi:hypothetical protein